MSMAIKYAMMKRGQKMARGGMCAHGSTDCHMCHGGKMMAKGGEMVTDENIRKHEEGLKPRTGMPEDKYWDRKFKLPSRKERAGVEAAARYDAHNKNRSEYYADGGFVEEEEDSGYRSMPKEHRKEDESAMMEDDRDLNQHGEHEEGAEGRLEDDESQHERMVEHSVENQDDEEDMVGRIMRQREQHYSRGGEVKKESDEEIKRDNKKKTAEAKAQGKAYLPRWTAKDYEEEQKMSHPVGHYSRGGRVSNDTPISADFADNQFDDLVKDDDLEEHYTGANSGDELGDAQEDEDRDDIVSRIMKSRKLRDRNPRPA